MCVNRWALSLYGRFHKGVGGAIKGQKKNLIVEKIVNHIKNQSKFDPNKEISLLDNSEKEWPFQFKELDPSKT